MYSIQHYVIKFIGDLQQFGGFLWGTPVSSTNKTDHHTITKTLLKIALSTITLTFTITSNFVMEFLPALFKQILTFDDLRLTIIVFMTTDEG